MYSYHLYREPGPSNQSLAYTHHGIAKHVTSMGRAIKPGWSRKEPNPSSWRDVMYQMFLPYLGGRQKLPESMKDTRAYLPRYPSRVGTRKDQAAIAVVPPPSSLSSAHRRSDSHRQNVRRSVMATEKAVGHVGSHTNIQLGSDERERMFRKDPSSEQEMSHRFRSCPSRPEMQACQKPVARRVGSPAMHLLAAGCPGSSAHSSSSIRPGSPCMQALT